MSENNINKNVRDDEIDLLDLFRRLGRTLGKWGNALGRAFLIIIVFLLRRWLPLGLSILLGIGVSYFFKTVYPSLYTSDLVLRNNNVSNLLLRNNNVSNVVLPNNILLNVVLPKNNESNADLISYLNRLHTYCIEKNVMALANAISISEQQAKNISDIITLWVIDLGKDGSPDYVDYRYSYNVNDTANSRMQDRLDIMVITKSPQELTNIRNGIISFISSDSLFQQRNRLRIRQNQELLTRLDYDILQLDSLQKVKYFEETRSRKPQNGGQMIFLQEQKTQLVYTDIYVLYAKKQVLESEMDLYKEIVTVISDFPLRIKRTNGTFFYFNQIIPKFFGLTLLVLILLANRKKLNEVYNKY